MTDYLYNAGTALNPSTSERTFQLLLPADQVEVMPEKLYESRIWVVTQIDGKKFLYAKMYPVSVESVETEIGEKKFVLNASVIKSSYFLSSTEHGRNQKYIVSDSFVNFHSMKLSEISLNESKVFEDIESSARQYAFSPPTPAFPSEEGLTESTHPLSVDLLVRGIVIVGKRNFSIADLARDARNKSWDEYHCFAFRHLLQSSRFDKNDIRKAIGNSQSRSSNDSPVRHPAVDTDLHSIDPEAIKSRTFVSPERTTLDSMAATEKAEQTHQAILRDVSEYLLTQNVAPLESSSVDLAIKLSAGLILFEIKSSNADNFYQQCDKALSQILRYDYEFHKAAIHVFSKYLIVEKSVGEFEEKHVTDFFKYCDIGVLYYNRTKAWPERLLGIESILC